MISFIVWKRMRQKKTIGKCEQKEPLLLHGQLNWYIFHTFHDKKFILTGLIIISFSYVHESVLNFPDCQIFLNLLHKVYNHKMYIGDLVAITYNSLYLHQLIQRVMARTVNSICSNKKAGVNFGIEINLVKKIWISIKTNQHYTKYCLSN